MNTAYLAEPRASYCPVRAPPVLLSPLSTGVGGTVHPADDKFVESHHPIPLDPRRHADVPPARLLLAIRNLSNQSAV